MVQTLWCLQIFIPSVKPLHLWFDNFVTTMKAGYNEPADNERLFLNAYYGPCSVFLETKSGYNGTRPLRYINYGPSAYVIREPSITAGPKCSEPTLPVRLKMFVYREALDVLNSFDFFVKSLENKRAALGILEFRHHPRCLMWEDNRERCLTATFCELAHLIFNNETIKVVILSKLVYKRVQYAIFSPRIKTPFEAVLHNNSLCWVN